MQTSVKAQHSPHENTFHFYKIWTFILICTELHPLMNICPSNKPDSFAIHALFSEKSRNM